MTDAIRITVRDAPPRAAWTLEQGGVHPLLARLYAARGIRAIEELDTRSSALLAPERLKGADDAATLAVFGALDHPARSGDALAWRDELARFEADWLAPALDALRGGRIEALRLLAPGELAAVDVQLRRQDLWKFWRKPGALTELGSP